MAEQKEIKHSAAAEEEDLEDGEIEDDDDDDDQVILVKETEQTDEIKPANKTASNNDLKKREQKVPIPIIDLVSNEDQTTIQRFNKSKFRKPSVVDDDFAGNIENAIAAALKKDGIEPPIPKILEKRQKEDDSNQKTSTTVTLTSSKRKNKRKKKDNADREKNHENKRQRRNHESATTAMATPLKNDDDDLDDALMYEMLGIRGGSPPPQTTATAPLLPGVVGTMSAPTFYTDESYSSYEDSYESDNEYRKSKGEQQRRGRRSNKKNRRGDRNRSRDRGGGGRDREKTRRKRNRAGNNSDDDSDDLSKNSNICQAYLRGQCLAEDCPKKHEGRIERKFELCKFYLKECCAKKDKCLYMHSDFPCKYYYLGMECIYKTECKYKHGEPLTDTLRNVLLKHIETAPKEILGTFRRISREHAIQLLNKQHTILCKKYNLENTYVTTQTTQSQSVNVTSSINNVNNKFSMTQASNINISNELVTTTKTTTMSTNSTHGIPSLLDMIIPQPVDFEPNEITSSPNNFQHDKMQRKSRWTTSTSIPTDTNLKNVPQQTSEMNLNQNNSSNMAEEKNDNPQVPNFLKLQYLHGILEDAQIEKLISIGVETIQQLTSLSLFQLNAVGLSINQLQEIQLNTMNLEKLGILKMEAEKSNPSLLSSSKANVENSSDEAKNEPFLLDAMKASNDIDMRVLPAITSPKSTNHTNATGCDLLKSLAPVTPALSLQTVTNGNEIDKKCDALPPVDYTQYLKDSHLDNDKIDMIDDDQKLIEDDEDQLKIDESAFDIDNDNDKSNASNGRSDSDRTSTPVGENNFDDNSNSSSHLLPPLITAFDQIKSKKVIDLSSTVSSMMKAQAAATKEKSSTTKSGHQQLPSLFSYFQSTQESKKKSVNDDTDENDKFKLNFLSGSSLSSFYGSSTSTNELKDKDSRKLLSSLTTFSSLEFRDSKKNFSSPRYSERSISPIKSPTYTIKEAVSYERPTMYDNKQFDDDDENYDIKTDSYDSSDVLKNKSDQDMRISEYLDSNDLDLRLPFKPVMTNYTPATEIDGSIMSNNTILYRVNEIHIPEPNFRSIRKSFPVNEKTLDPRIRRIFGLKEECSSSVNLHGGSNVNTTNSTSSSKQKHLNSATNYESDSENLNSLMSSPSSATSSVNVTKEKYEIPESQTTSARLDPRKRKNDSDSLILTDFKQSSSSAHQSNNVLNQQNNDIRMILQKSTWYKNLNSKFKIMINQQLAMVSTELKKFHQNPSKNKIFDISFILQNQTLQQILTNLCIYIDDNGIIRSVDSDSESSDSGIYGGNKNNPLNIVNVSKNLTLPNQNSAATTMANSLLGFPTNMLDINNTNGNSQNNNMNLNMNNPGQQKSNQLINIGGLLEIPTLNPNSVDYLRGGPPQSTQFNNLQQQQHQQMQHRFGTMAAAAAAAAALSNQFGPNTTLPFPPNGPQEMRPGLLGVAPGIGYNNQFLGGLCSRPPNIDNKCILPLLANDSLLGNPQFAAAAAANNQIGNFTKFNDPRNRNMLNKGNTNNNNNKRFNNFNSNNNHGNNRDRRNFNENNRPANNRDNNNRNRDKRKI